MTTLKAIGELGHIVLRIWLLIRVWIVFNGDKPVRSDWLRLTLFLVVLAL